MWWICRPPEDDLYISITSQYIYDARSYIIFVSFLNQLVATDLFTQFLLDEVFTAASSK
jgi:hypothetical protein